MDDTPRLDDNPDYWDDYGPLQAKKHELVRRYLQAWFPILAASSGRIVYFETHAGRGAYGGGREGSPIVALRTLLDHRSLTRILRTCKVTFVFVEQDPENYGHLQDEVQRLERDPRFDAEAITVATACGDSFTMLSQILDQMEDARDELAPSLFFVDPYGFKLEGSVMSRVLRMPHTEIIVNIMWHNVQQALGLGVRAPGMRETLSRLFNTEAWDAQLQPHLSDHQKADVAIDLLAKAYGAKYGSALKLREERGGIKYFLLHLTNNLAGRKKMKEILWGIAGPGFIFRTSGSLNQGFLFGEELNIEPTKQWVRKALARGHRDLAHIEDDFALTDWKDKHLTAALRQLYKAGEIETKPPMTGKALIRSRVRSLRLSKTK